MSTLSSSFCEKTPSMRTNSTNSTRCRQEPQQRRKLRALVITMGGDRQRHIEEMFAAHSDDFEPPVFSPGVPQRSLRNRANFLRIAHQAGLLPEAEWRVLMAAFDNEEYHHHPEQFFDCLKDTPVTVGRHGSQFDVSLHYSVELWQKGKSLNRGRSVLACTLAHLIAMKSFVGKEGPIFDILLEDNVRLCEGAADRIWEILQTSSLSSTIEPENVHLRYFGWLGSLPNLQWVFDTHKPKYGIPGEDGRAKIVPFPIPQDFESNLDVDETAATTAESKIDNIQHKQEDGEAKENGASRAHTKPGGTAVWGAYAYWISKEAYRHLLKQLRNDVGALLWKGKRMRAYAVKPVDKIIPRQIIKAYNNNRNVVQISLAPSFFRAPMLTSKIHSQYDPEFCKSTEYQLGQTELGWDRLWLTQDEREIVNRREETGEWITQGRLVEMRATSDKSEENHE